jgi:hypothetical protein
MPAESKKKDPVVYALSRPSRCYGCDKRMIVDEIVKLDEKEDEKEVYCCNCAGLADLTLLASGNATVTRLAKKYSQIRFVVVKWSDTWKCYERQGLLVEKQALERAQKESNLR